MSVFLRIISIVLAVLFFLWLGGLIAFTTDVLSQPPIDNSRTEAIVVLTGGPDRINTGLDLLSEGKADYLFITGVNKDVTIEELLTMWRGPQDVEPPCCILLGHQAHNTYENAAEARNWIKAQHIKSVRLLTTDYHMPRAKLEFTAVLPETEIHLHPIPSTHANWMLIIGEYHKTLYTFLRVRLS